MSWSTSIRAESVEDGVARLQALEVPTNDHAPAETAEQFAQVREAAVALLESGALGLGRFYVNLSGHANPGHQQTPGWGTDGIGISISVAPDEAVW